MFLSKNGRIKLVFFFIQRKDIYKNETYAKVQEGHLLEICKTLRQPDAKYNWCLNRVHITERKRFSMIFTNPEQILWRSQTILYPVEMVSFISIQRIRGERCSKLLGC